MSRSHPAPSFTPLIASLWLACAATFAHAEPMTDVHALAQKEQQPLLDTLRDLVGIESGSKDVDGLEKIAERVAGQLKQLGGTVEILHPTDIYRLDDTPETIGPAVHAVFKGTGSKKIMLIAHMDTVYLKGMLKDQPFRVDGDKAYGLGIADDKQGVALILHTVAMLQKLNFKDYGTLTVLTNGDEEISSPGWRSTIAKFAADQDVVFSFEGGGTDGTLRLATARCASPPVASARPISRCRASPRTRARGPRAASTRCTSSRTRCCR
ncbi:acetylornithine deacetylase/succinyl-diaminopimelate desuccinylase-like protein [Bradyrhizobium diazoefficiens]